MAVAAVAAVRCRLAPGVAFGHIGHAHAGR
eukprot:COSAG02_NODE_30730_length_546_cov_1.006711_1_plen_29_part_10